MRELGLDSQEDDKNSNSIINNMIKPNIYLADLEGDGETVEEN